jgi:hypothetical protein
MREAGRKALAAAVVLAVAATAACGGSSRMTKAQYQQKIKSEGSQLASELRGLNVQAAGGDMKALAPKLGEVQRKIDATAADIAKLNPPKDAEADNNKIADTLHKFAAVFGRMKTAAAKGDKNAVQSLLAGLQAAAQEGNQATQDLKRKGYDIGAFGQ